MSKAKGENPTVLQMNILDLWAQGHSNDSIASALNCSVETIRSVKKSEPLKKIFYERQNAQIVDVLPIAIKRLITILRDDDVQAAVHIAAVKEVFDRAHLTELTQIGDKEIKISVTYE